MVRPRQGNRSQLPRRRRREPGSRLREPRRALVQVRRIALATAAATSTTCAWHAGPSVSAPASTLAVAPLGAVNARQPAGRARGEGDRARCRLADSSTRRAGDEEDAHSALGRWRRRCGGRRRCGSRLHCILEGGRRPRSEHRLGRHACEGRRHLHIDLRHAFGATLCPLLTPRGEDLATERPP